MRAMKLLILISFLLASTSLSLAATQARKIDSFGAIQCDDEMARLDMLAIELQKAPGTQAYIFIYGGRRDTKRDEIQIRGARMKRYLVENRSLPPDRIQLFNGGYREEFTVELWLIPNGESAPGASPTVKERDVRFKRGRMARYREPGCYPGKYVVRKARRA